jgi:hypothetical protein
MNFKVIIFTDLYIGKPYQYLGHVYMFYCNHDTSQSVVKMDTKIWKKKKGKPQQRSRDDIVERAGHAWQ